jgi:hypothetical protein
MATDDADDPTSGAPSGERESRDHRDHLTESLRARLEMLVPDLVRKTFSAGMGAVFSTEDSLRRLTKDLNVPNVAGYLGEAADNTKDRLLEIIAREVREFLSHVNLTEEISKLLTTLSFEVKTEIRFIPNSERYTGVEPDVKAAVRIKRAEEPEAGSAAAPTATPSARERRAASVSRLRKLWRRATDQD